MHQLPDGLSLVRSYNGLCCCPFFEDFLERKVVSARCKIATRTGTRKRRPSKSGQASSPARDFSFVCLFAKHHGTFLVRDIRNKQEQSAAAADQARAKDAARQSHESRQAAFGAKMKRVNDAWFEAEAKYAYAEDEGNAPAVIPTDPLHRVLLQPWKDEVPAGAHTPYVTPAWPLQGIA